MKSGEYGYPTGAYHYGESQKYPEQYVKHGASYGAGLTQEAYKSKVPHTYQQTGEHIVTGKYQQSTYKPTYQQGMYQGQSQEGSYSSGSYPGTSGYYGTYPTGTFQGYKGHDEYLHNYYQSKYIGDIIGGAVSLDGKPLGYPFDRQLAHSAFYAHNIYVKDVVVYHQYDYIPEY